MMAYQTKLSTKCFFISCMLMIFGSLFYISFYPQSNIYEHEFDANSPIERVLKQMSTCSSDDRVRQRALLSTLHVWHKFAQHHHIPYWIGYQTLLGYVHRQGLLAHQSEIDVFIMAHHTSQLLHISRSQSPSAVYQLRVHPQWYLVKQTERSYFHSEEIDFIAPNARFIHTDEHVHINIWPVYDYNPNEIRIEVNSKPMLTVYDNTNQWKSLPRDWTYPLRECEYSGVKVWCPAKTQELVEDMYGKISDDQLNKQCVNGSWAKDEESKSLAKNIQIIKSSTTTITQQPSISTTKHHQLSDSELIEKALNQTPTCTLSDRSRQKILLTNLQTWAKLAEKHHLQYWLSAGSLVGYVQRGGLLPHDPDTDITMMSDDVPRLIDIAQSNFSSKYEIKVHPQWDIVGYQNRSYHEAQGIPFVAPNARFIHRQSGKHVDIFPAYYFNPDSFTQTSEKQLSKNLTEYNLSYGWLSYPREWTYPLQTCYFSGIKVLCPAQPKKLVEAMYGVEALTRSDTKCINGKWVHFRLKKSN